MAKGRKRKPGKRTKSGALSRAGKPSGPQRVQPNERAAAMIAMFGDHWSTQLGRAYAAGLLDGDDDGSLAKARLDGGHRIAKAYWAAYETGGYRCALNDGTSGGSGAFDAEKIIAREKRLSDDLHRVQKAGVRRQFDALVIDVYVDAGPCELDRLIWAKRREVEPDIADAQWLQAALLGLDRVIG